MLIDVIKPYTVQQDVYYKMGLGNFTNPNFNAVFTENKPIGTSILGTVYYDSFTLINGDKQTEEIHNVRISVSNDFNIVKTDVRGRAGTVKQFVNTGDYKIDVELLFVTDIHNGDAINAANRQNYNFLPNERLSNYLKFINDAYDRRILNFGVKSYYLNTIYNVDRVVIGSVKSESGDSTNTYKLNLKLISDYAVPDESEIFS